MHDSRKTKAELIEDLRVLRKRVAELERPDETAGDDDGGLQQEGGRSRADLAAAQSLRRYPRAVVTLLSNLPGLVYRCRNDRKWTMELLSEGCYELTGYRPADFIEDRGLTLADLIHPDDREGVWEDVQAALRERRAFRLEYRIRTAGGEEKWAWEQGRGVFSPAGKVLALEGFITDITDRKRAEEDLLKTQRRLQGVISSSPAVIYSCGPGPDYRTTFISENIVTQLGYQPEQFYEDPAFWTRRVHPDDTGRVLHELLRIEQEEHLSYEYRFRHRDGHFLWFHDELVALKDAGGNVLELVGGWFDITARKQAEEALRESEERYRNLFGRVPVGLYRTTRTGRILDANPALAQIFGYADRESFLSCNVNDLYIHPDERREQMVRLERDGVVVGVETEARRRDGTIIWVKNSARTIRGADGKVVCYEGSLVDITARRQAEEELRRHREHLEELVGERTAELSAAKDRLQAELAERRRAEEALRSKEAEWRSIVTSAPDFILTIDREGKILFINRTVAGFTVEETVGRTIYEFVPAEDRETNRQAIERVFKTGEVVSFETSVAGPGGSTSWYSNRMGPIKRGGQIVAVTQICTDVTERRRAEEAVRAGAEQLRLITDSVRALIAYVGADGRYRFVNRQYELWHNRPREEIIGKHVSELLGEDNYRAVKPHLEAALSGKEVSYEASMKLADGKTRWLHMIYVPHRGSAGRTIGFCSLVNDVTEHRQVEEALRESEAKQRQLIDTVRDAIMVLDAETMGFVIVNDAAVDLYGYSREEFLRLRQPDITTEPEESRAAIKQALVDKVMRVPLRYHKKKDGTVFPTEITASVLELGDRRLLCGVVRDITERRRAEEALRESEERFRMLFENSPIGIYRTTPEGRIDKANPALVKMLGFSSFEELAKRNLEEDGFERDYPRSEFRERVERDGTVTLDETAWKKRDGTPIFVRENARAIRDATGEVIYYEGTVEDVTERRRAEAALRESEQLFRAVVGASKDAMIAIDEEGLITIFNPAAAEMFGRGSDEMIGQPLDCLMPEEYRSRHRQYVRGYFTAGTPREAIGRTLELPAVRKDGTVFTVELSLSAGQRGERPFVLAVIRDITERKRVEEERTRLAEQLQQAQRMQAVGEVAAGIAHDFGNLLAEAGMKVRRLQKMAAANDEMREVLDAIERVVDEATGSAESLLTYSQQLPAERIPLEMGQFVEDAAQALRHLVPEAIELQVDRCDDQVCWVNADPNQLQQVLQNLVLNARDAMPGGGKLGISVRPLTGDQPSEAGEALVPRPPAVRLKISDTGVGIPADLRERIFEAGFTTRPRGRGMGFGLATVRSVVKHHGGRIEVESEVGRGSSFAVILPGASLGPATAAAAPPQGHGEIVVLGEANRHVRRLITATLRSWNYEVVTPADGPACCEAFNQDPDRVAVLIMKADPPERAGLECLRSIRAAGYQTPVILTGETFDAEVKAARDAATVLLRKPFQMVELGACLRKLLADRGRTQG